MIDNYNESLLDKSINAIDMKLSIKFAFILALINASDAIEILCISFIMNELHLSTKYKELLSASIFMGMLFGGLLCGYISDKVGRKYCLLLSVFINILFSFLSIFSQNIIYLIIFRIISGIGIGGSIPVMFTLGVELFPRLHRGKLISLIASFWMVGAIYTGIVGWILLGNDQNGNKIINVEFVNWRIFGLFCIFPIIIAFFCTYIYVPESPRYLIKYKKYVEAINILNKISHVHITLEQLTTDLLNNHNNHNNHNNNDNNDIEKIYNPSLPIIKNFKGYSILSDAIKSDCIDDNEINNVSLLTINDSLFILFNKIYIKRTIVFMCVWFLLSFGSYGISTWITILYNDVGINNVYAATFIFACANLPGNIISMLYMDSFGRHNILMYAMILAALSAIGFAIDTKNKIIVILCSSLFNAFSVAGWNSLDCMSAEEFPTEIRSMAMGLIAGCGRFGAITGQFVNGTLEHNISLLLFVTSSCMMLGGLITIFLGEDTTNKNIY